jgi:uncharacterized protein with GYD domain
MNTYLFQVSYTSEAWRALIKKRENRAEVVRPVIQNMGGDITISWVCAGDYDLMVIMRLPDETSALAASMIFKAGGALREVRYTRLHSWQEGLEAMTKASEIEYRPPQLLDETAGPE